VREKTLRALIFSIISLSLVGSIKVLFNIIVGRAFDAEILGMVSVALSLALFIAILCSTGFATSLNKFIADCLSRNEVGAARKVLDSVIRFSIIIAVPIMIVIWLLSGGISDLLNTETEYLFSAIPIIFFGFLYYLYRAAFYSLGAPKEYLKREFVADIFFIIILLLLIFLQLDTLALLAFSSMYIFFLIISRGEINRRLPRGDTKRFSIPVGITSFTILSAIATIMSLSTIYIANMYTGAVLGAKEVGLYVAAFSATTLVLLIPNGLALVLLPEISFMWAAERREDIRAYATTWMVVLLIISAIIVGPMIILSGDIIALLFGEGFRSAEVAMVPLLIGVFMTMIARPAMTALLGTEYVRVTASFSIMGFASAFVVWSLLIPSEGIVGTAFGYVAAATINSLGPILYAGKKLKMGLLSNALPLGLFALLMIALFTFMPMETLSQRILSTGIFLGIFLIGNSILIKRLLKEIKRF